MTAAYPLVWPEHIARSTKRESSRFRTQLPGALANVGDSLKGFARESGKAVSNIVLSSNVALGIDKPADPGVAAWFEWDGLQVCFAIDRYATPAENLQAIHHIIEARRTELRHGTLALVRASMTGLRALPAPARRPWQKVLDLPDDAMPGAIEAAHKRLTQIHHPDRPGGSIEAMAEVNIARDEALRALRGQG